MKLNNNQKRFLFENNYLDAKCLDSLTHKGWEEYWINNYDFELDLNLNGWNMRTLTLIDKDNMCRNIEIDLIFQNDDFNKLLSIKEVEEKIIEIKLTLHEFDCLLGHMQVDKEIFQEIVEDENITDENDYSKVMLKLVERFENIRLNTEEFHK